MSQTQSFSVQDASQVAVVRRAAVELAQTVGLDEQRQSAIAVTVNELANNLLQHAGEGKIFVQYLEPLGALDIIAVDHGPGMANVEVCLEDGYSSRDTPGLGLGAVRRFAKSFDIFSVPKRTTVVLARVAETKRSPDLGLLNTAVAGETASGDSWAVSGEKFMLVDGLGHGILASEAARAATETFKKKSDSEPGVLIEQVHGSLRATRGAAAAIASVAPLEGRIRFAGVGNIAASIVSEGSTQNLVSHNGTLGHQMRRVQQFEYPYKPGDLLVMQSDGLTTHPKQPMPPALWQKTPALIAAFIYAEQLRGRDDATVMVVRLG